MSPEIVVSILNRLVVTSIHNNSLSLLPNRSNVFCASSGFFGPGIIFDLNHQDRHFYTMERISAVSFRPSRTHRRSIIRNPIGLNIDSRPAARKMPSKWPSCPVPTRRRPPRWPPRGRMPAPPHGRCRSLRL